MGESKRILVVDDDSDIHDFCRLVLEREGYEVASAYSADEGRKSALAARPDLVVLDVMMEQADAGFEAAKWFAAELPEVPVLMMSSIADAADQLFDTSTLSLADLVNKPIAPGDLLRRVGRLLERAREK
jgi:DNA-binding response OmpR family regulator